MKINNDNIDINEAIEIADIDSIVMKRRENNLLLNDYQIEVLKLNGINYLEYCNMKELLFKIEECLDDNFDEELDIVSNQLSEFIYYNESKK